MRFKDNKFKDCTLYQLDSIFYIIASMLLVIEWFVFRNTMWQDRPSFLGQLFKIGADGTLIYLFFWVVKAKWRRLMLIIPLWFMSIFFLANTLYHSAFNDFLPFTSLFFTANYNSMVIESIPALWRLQDWTFVVLPALFTASCIFVKRNNAKPYTLRIKWIAVAVTLVWFILCQSLYTAVLKRKCESEGINRSWFQVMTIQYANTQESLPRVLGMPVYIAKELIMALTRSYEPIELSKEQTAKIKRYLNEQPELTAIPEFSQNKGKNLILIVVESLNAFVVNNTIGGVEISPTLNRLIKEDGTISALHVVPQIGDGRSSDGQMLYLSGLLPIKCGAASLLYPRIEYPSLPKILDDYTSIEYIVDNPQCWNHYITTTANGFNGIFSEHDIPERSRKELGRDKALFDFAATKLAVLEQPFFAHINTMSMHLPYHEDAAKRIPEVDNDMSLSKGEKNYYTVVRYFDDALCEFLEQLKISGIYDNSVIVIASDHNEATHGSDYIAAKAVAPSDIVFLALNTGMTRRVDYPIGQVDIFPTLLQIMYLTESSWKGLGCSMLTYRGGIIDRQSDMHGEAENSVERHNREAWEISDLMIRGNYFKKADPVP